MFRNYLKIAYRNFVRHKMFSFINVFGLAIGLSICMIIMLWVQRELSYDRFHEDSDRIYRVERELFRENAYSTWPVSSALYKQALIDDYPEIENAVRLWRREFAIKDHKNFAHRQVLWAADNSLFEIFDFGLEQGDPRTALTQPMTVVLTRFAALKYFGTSSDIIGRSLTLEWDGQPVDFTVTGILDEVPENSHIHFDMLISFSSYPDDRFPSWRSNYLYTYLLTRKNTPKQAVEAQLETFVEKRLKPHYGDLTAQGLGIHEVLRMYLFPISDIHLHPSVNWEIEPGGSMASVYIFSSIAALILIIACINFVNLSTARASKRAKEVSLRKTVGASKNQLRRQFFQESVLMAFIGLALAFLLSSLFVPAYNRMFSENLSVSSLHQLKNLLLLAGATLAAGLLSGLYPAFHLARFEPVSVMKGGPLSKKGSSFFRRNMVVVQFVISTVLIIGVFTIYRQMRYIQNRSLGFDKENVVIIPARSRHVSESFASFRNELISDARIVSVTGSTDIPGEPRYGNGQVQHRESNAVANVTFFWSDYDYIETYKMEMLAGRAFSRDFSTDKEGDAILNEATAKKLGWTPEQAVEKKLEGGFSEAGVRVVGVVRDFNYKSLRHEVEPMVLLLAPGNIFSISVRILPGEVEKTLGFIRQKWELSFPGELFEFGFLDSSIDTLYEQDKKMQKIFIVFSGLSILVACLGLFGLAAFTAEVRTKEIGIRKALGASVQSVTFLLSKEFFKWIVLANIAAWPLAWFMMKKWLQSFAYKVDVGWFVFLIAALTTLFIAAFSFIFQAVKAAAANPADSLRYE